MEIREIHTENGVGVILLYSNNNLNTNGRRIDVIHAAAASGSWTASVPVKLYESDHNSGVFYAWLPPEKLYRLGPGNSTRSAGRIAGAPRPDLTFHLRDGEKNRRAFIRLR
jgi:hypothetical protein